MCGTKTKVAAGTLNRAFADKNGKLYIGDGSGYYANASGSWVSKPLNSSTWTIDQNGAPHTVYTVGFTTNAHLVHSTLVNGVWTAEDVPHIPDNDPFCPDPEGAYPTDIDLDANGSPYVSWTTAVWWGCTFVKTYSAHSYKSGSQG